MAAVINKYLALPKAPVPKPSAKPRSPFLLHPRQPRPGLSSRPGFTELPNAPVDPSQDRSLCDLCVRSKTAGNVNNAAPLTPCPCLTQTPIWPLPAMPYTAALILLVLALTGGRAAMPLLSPEAQPSPGDLRPRQLGGIGGTTMKEFTRGGCKEIILVYARGSTEQGNVGSLGPLLSSGLKSRFRSVAVEGVDYAAGLATNALPGGADPAGTREMRRLVILAASRCPRSAVLVGGYSQGAAVTHRAVESLSAQVMQHIVAVFMFGDTQYTQDRGRIRGFPPSHTLIICNTGDAVCSGSLVIMPAHLMYAPRVNEVIAFLTRRLLQSGFRIPGR